MSRKLAIEEMHQLAEKRGGKCLSYTYVNSHRRLLWECKRGHQWEATPKNIKRGAWCHICGGSIKLTIDDMRRLAEECGGKCLSDVYVNSASKLLWKCTEGHIWKAVPGSVKSGCWCPQCAKKKSAQALRLNINTMQRLAERKGGKCLSSSYINAHTKLLWECAEGHQWESAPNYIQQGSWCPFCSGNTKSTIEEMQAIAKERGGRCLSNAYVNSNTKLLWVCTEGHQWEATPGTVKRGSWCPFCAGRGKTIEDMKKLAEERGGRCLSDIYMNVDTKLLWECAEGHQWEATPYKIVAGTWCPKCSSGLGERICREFLEQIFERRFPKSYPKWLVNKDGNQMELDGFCESLRIAFEHQGEQHYSTGTQFITTEEELQKRQEDDKLKAELCEQRGIVLIAIPEISGRLPISEVRQYVKTECEHYSVPLPTDFDTKYVDLKKAYATSGSREALNELRAIAKQRGGKCLSDAYVDYSTPLCWECKEGHQWEATPSNIKNQGSWCPTCAGRPKLNIDEMCQLAQERGGRCLSETYTNKSTKLLWECNEGHRWEAEPNSVRNAGRWCPICAKLRSGATQRLDIHEMQEIAKSRGGKCLSDKYINNKTKLLWECKEGHNWLAATSKIKSGQWCPTCAGRPVLTIKDMKILAETRGGKCLSDTYVNSKTKLLWECRKEHRWEAVSSSVRSGTWCPKCRRLN